MTENTETVLPKPVRVEIAARDCEVFVTFVIFVIFVICLGPGIASASAGRGRETSLQLLGCGKLNTL